ncbi:ThiF family adenylyltransferase [Amycolatopsis anabasis]|uniref:ThiF family adenylyltransferase n=1 Tax=Amycolatopsis anabasis TaxID=1840409 RepID=UPI00131C36AF|nr:ThiF family adenylyltransferase [Amycolatopsis anabasis]
MTDQLTEFPEVTLPQWPRLLTGLEVLERGEDEIQIGLDPRHGVMASGLPPDLVAALRSLDGTRRTEALLALAKSEHVEELRAVLTGLTQLGLIEDAGPPARHRRPAAEAGLWSLRSRRPRQEIATRREHAAVVLHGSGRLAIAMATQLAAAGIGRIHVETSGNVTEEDLGCGYVESDLGSSRAAASIAAIRRTNPATRTGRLPSDRRPELVVLTDAVVPAPEVVCMLVAESVPHLAVRIRDGLGIVGPLVLPGRSSCLRCADLHRTALDACWPKVASQLAGRRQQADLASVHATAAMACGQVLRILNPGDGPPPVWNATIEIDTYEGTMGRTEWPPHPACTCEAARTNA